VAVFLYFQIGTPQALTPGQQQALPSRQSQEVATEAPASQPGMPSQQQIEERVAGLAARLKENPNDAKGWTMLARSYQSFNRYKEASDAYARAAELTGNDAQLWADYAETLALANDSQLQGRPIEIINKALQLDPKNQKALWLAGNAAFQAKDFQQAISYWEKLEKLLPEGSEGAQSVATSIEEARARISGK
jgi:cytochrome c-type biogenesis protein CcmH